MSKTTKEQRATYRSLFAESQSPLAGFVKQMIDDLEAAEAEVQRLREQTQWRGIETAPKRQPVLVLCEGGQCYVLYQTDNGEGYMDNWRWHDGTAFGRWPIKYMLLPQPPQAQESDGARCA